MINFGLSQAEQLGVQLITTNLKTYGQTAAAVEVPPEFKMMEMSEKIGTFLIFIDQAKPRYFCVNIRLNAKNRLP